MAAEYGKFAVVAPGRTEGLAPSVIAGTALYVSTTSSVEAAQGELLIVQRKVYVPVPPAGVNVAVGKFTLLNCDASVEGPLTTVHVPAPTEGVLAARVAAEVPQKL